jgi:hypothetical protein
MKRVEKVGLAIALTAGLSWFVVANADSVESQNIVGFSEVVLEPGLNLLGYNWEQVGGENPDEVPIQDIFLNTNALTAGGGFGVSDQILAWNGAGYTLYWYKAYDASKFTDGPAWVKEGSESVPTADVILQKEGFWFRKRGDVSVTNKVAGQVSRADAVHSVDDGLNMISSAYPADASLNDTNRWDWSEATAGGGFGVSDQILVWNGAGYTLYWYKAYDASKFTDGPAWVKEGSESTPTVDVIPLGLGVWYRARAVDTTIMEKKIVE